MSDSDELPWYWCATHDSDLTQCPCNDREVPMAGYPDGWDASMKQVVWTDEPLRRRPVQDVELPGEET